MDRTGETDGTVDGRQGAPPSPAHRRRVVTATATAAVLLSVGGLVGANWVQSPSQAAADSRAPSPDVITAPVTRQVLRSTVVLRGTFADDRTVSSEPTTVASTETSSQPARLMVTGVYAHPGQSVRAAQVLVEYSGRPVFALKGDVPAYRDLAFGERGKDIAQLQASLQSLGQSTAPDPRGVFGSGTEKAVEWLYRRLGYPAPVSPAGEPAAQAMVPASEVVFVPDVPARVVSVPVRVGDPVKGPVVTLARGEMTLTGRLDPSRQGLVTAGMKAQVLAETTGVQAEGTVESVGGLVVPGDKAADGADGAPADAAGGDAAYLPLTVRPATVWDPAFVGLDVRVTITAAATSRAVLAVPEAAISAGADTRTTVTVVGTGGAKRVVPVTTGVSADGLVEVTPPSGAVLAPGEKVVVGR